MSYAGLAEQDRKGRPAATRPETPHVHVQYLLAHHVVHTGLNRIPKMVKQFLRWYGDVLAIFAGERFVVVRQRPQGRKEANSGCMHGLEAVLDSMTQAHPNTFNPTDRYFMTTMSQKIPRFHGFYIVVRHPSGNYESIRHEHLYLTLFGSYEIRAGSTLESKLRAGQSEKLVADVGNLITYSYKFHNIRIVEEELKVYALYVIPREAFAEIFQAVCMALVI